MRLEYRENAGEVTISVYGELDHHAAKEAMREIGRIIDACLPTSCVLDMRGLSFMDSSGIALMLSARKRMGELGGQVEVRNLPEQAARVARAAGLDRVIVMSRG